MKKIRLWKITQHEVNKKTGESLHFGIDNINELLTNPKIEPHLIKVMFIRHDKDDTTPHWHIALWTDGELNYQEIGNALGLDDWMSYRLVKPIEMLYNSHEHRPQTEEEAWIQYGRYMIHDRAMPSCVSKHHYSIEDIYADFDYKKEVMGL